ncbi:MAG TPA: hypothetical protein VK066_24520 [Chloroflexota bacterium]|nr:hypothetical protein [Chloroflexota bacterium]
MDATAVLAALARLLVFACGLYLVVLTVGSAVRTFVLPRDAVVKLTHVVFRCVRACIGVALRRAHSYRERDAVMALYAPLALLALPVVWLMLVGVGYTAMFWALGVGPPDEAFMVSGSSLLTLGFATAHDPPTAALAFSEAMLGLILVALLIAYLPTMYGAFQRRETAVTLLAVRAGTPPSAVELFTRFYRLDHLDRLLDLWTTWELWFAELEESHTSLPALVFFRSPLPERSWVTAAGAVLDAAALYSSTLAVPREPQAEITIRAGYLALRRIARFFRIPYDPDPRPDDPISVTRAEFEAACDQLAAVGVPLQPDRDACWRAFAGWRVNYDTVLVELARLTFAPPAPWSADRVLVRAPTVDGR